MDGSLACTRCHQPLLRDPTVANLTPSQFALVAGTLPAPSSPSSLSAKGKLDALPPASRSAAAAWASANPISESYVLLPERGGSKAPAQDRSKGKDKTPARRGSRDNGAGVAVGLGAAATDPAAATSSSTPSSSDSQSRADSPSGVRPNLAAKLDTLLSSRTAIDHPLCHECTTLFQAELQRELEELTRERDAYIAFERNLRKRAPAAADTDTEAAGSAADTALVGTADEWDALVARQAELEDEETQLRATLKEREQELHRVKDDEARLKAEEEAVEREEAEFLKSHAALSGELVHLSHTLQSAKTQLLLSQSLLQHLESTNVYNDAFQIGHAPLATDAAGGRTGNVGTINGLRLGGRPTVEWEEINAAWGLVALCIDRLAAKVGCTFQSYKIVPLGSFSRIEETSPSKTTYELYASGDISPQRLLQNRRFSSGLVALLDCLRQLLNFGKDAGRAWGTGVEISKDRINGHSIRLPGITSGLPALGSMSIMGLGAAEEPKDAGNADEQWTRACRAVLTALKRILVVESEAERGA